MSLPKKGQIKPNLLKAVTQKGDVKNVRGREADKAGIILNALKVKSIRGLEDAGNTEQIVRNREIAEMIKLKI